MKILIVDPNAVGADIGICFSKVGCEVYQLKPLNKWVQLPDMEPCAVEPDGPFGCALIHKSEIGEYHERWPTTVELFYSTVLQLKPDPDWIQRPLGAEAIKPREALELVEWLEQGRPSDHLPALLRHEEPEADPLTALLLLCQAFLVAHAESSLGSSLTIQALQRMGWRPEEGGNLLVSKELSDTLSRGDWWLSKMMVTASKLREHCKAAGDLQATLTLVKSLEECGMISPEVAAAAYIELADWNQGRRMAQ